MFEKLRETARELLSKGEVECVLGFAEGTLPMFYTPYLARKPEEAEKLVYGPFAAPNIATYLRKLKGKKAAVIVRGCESRTINLLISEKQLNRDDVKIIGVPCVGALDRKRILKDYGGEIREARIEGKKVIVKGDKGEKAYVLEEYISPSCRSCLYPEAIDPDIKIEGPSRDGEKADFSDIERIEKMSPAEKWEFFEKELSKCIRCYACREICPMCYCDSCFVDSNRPVWVEPGFDYSDILSFHLIKMYHMAGRCVDCGACERACPLGIRLSFLTRKLTKDMKEAYNFVSGLSPEEKPALGVFSPDDREDFIL